MSNNSKPITEEDVRRLGFSSYDEANEFLKNRISLAKSLYEKKHAAQLAQIEAYVEPPAFEQKIEEKPKKRPIIEIWLERLENAPETFTALELYNTCRLSYKYLLKKGIIERIGEQASESTKRTSYVYRRKHPLEPL